MGPALGVLELASIARGARAADAVVKRAEVTIVASRAVSGGGHLSYFRGGVAELDEGLRAGIEIAGSALVDSLFLPLAATQLWAALPDPLALSWTGDELAAAVVETETVSAALAAADAACKAAEVTLRDVRLAAGIAGKGYFSMTGELTDIEAAAAAAAAAAGSRLRELEIIAAPAPELLGQLFR